MVPSSAYPMASSTATAMTSTPSRSTSVLLTFLGTSSKEPNSAMFVTMLVTHSIFPIVQSVFLRRNKSNTSSACDPSLTSIPIVRYLREKLKRLAALSITVHLSSLSVVLISPTYTIGSQTFEEISSRVILPLPFAQIFSGGSCYSTQEPFHAHSTHVLPPEITIFGWTLP